MWERDLQRPPRGMHSPVCTVGALVLVLGSYVQLTGPALLCGDTGKDCNPIRKQSLVIFFEVNAQNVES